MAGIKPHSDANPSALPHFPKLRRRSHRAFVDWCRHHPERLRKPVCFAGQKGDCLRLAIPGLHPALVITLTWELVIGVEWQNQCWDLLTCFEADPEKRSDGVYCNLCLSTAQVPYPSREALWRHHLFEPFADWLTHTLMPAKWIGLYSTSGGGVTWAKLLGEPDKEAVIVLPVWP